MPPCPHCSSTEHELNLKFTTPEAPHLPEPRFDVMRCRKCGLLGLRELPPPEELASYYQETYYRPEDARRFPPPLEWAVRKFREGRARAVKRITPAGGRVLDVGCGRGLMLSTLRSWGYRVAGTQLSRTAADAIARRDPKVEIYVGELTDPAAPFEAASFDTITMLHVLEHVRDPQAYLQRIAELLKPGGTLLLEVPNADSITARAAGLGWVHWDIPRHLWHFTPATLRACIESAGLTAEAPRKIVSLEYAPFGIVQAILNAASRRGPRHRLFNFLSATSAPRRLSSGSAADVIAGAFLTPGAVFASAIEAAAGRGQMLQIWARKQ